MKKVFLNLSVLLFGVFLLGSCFFKDPGTEIKFGGLLIEIDKATAPGDANTKDTRQYEKVFDNQFTRDSVRINLVGPHQNEDIAVSFEVGTSADGSGTTAVAGVHYRLPSGNSIVIPAGKSFGYLYFEVNDDILSTQPEDFVAIRFNLTSTSKGLLSENYKTHRVVIGGKCTYDLSKFIGNYRVNEPGYGNYLTVSVAGPNPNSFVIDNFWDVGASVKYVIDPSTGTISIPGDVFTFGPNTYNVVGGPGTIDPCTGNFTIPYTVRAGGTIGSGGIVDNNTHTFTKLP